MQKTKQFKISAYSVDNCGSKGKNRGFAITQSTLGWGLIKNLFSKKWRYPQKTKKFWISAYSADNCASQGKNRVLVIK